MSDGKDIILVIATGWGPKHGGINAFNKGLCIGIANYIKEEKLAIEVVCAVSSHDKLDTEDARNHSVVLISFEPEKKNEFLNANDIFKIKDELKRYNSGHKRVKHVILHDLSTGSLLENKENVFPQAKLSWSAIHHMHYRKYEHLKGYGKSLGKIEKSMSQYKLFNNVDNVFAVGPYLKELLEKWFQEKSKKIEIVELIPGLQTQDKLEKNDPENSINGITFGRLDVNHDDIKLASLAMQAWVNTIKPQKNSKQNLENSELKIVGLNFDNEFDKEECEKIQKEHGNLISLLPYTTESPTLNYLLSETTIAFMLSRHEGFGLTGWEAIGAGIPLITTTNSGLYKFLKEYRGGDFGHQLKAGHFP